MYCYKMSYQILLGWDTQFFCGRSLLCPPLPGKVIKVSFFKNFILFIFIFGCLRAFSSCGERGLLFVVVRGLLIAVASLVVEHGL